MIRKNWRDPNTRNMGTEYRNTFRRRMEKNIITDDLIEAESQKEFDILAKTMGAKDSDLSKEADMLYQIIIGRLKEDPKEEGGKVFITVMSETVPDGVKEHRCSTGGKLKEPMMSQLHKGDLVCVEAKPSKGSDGTQSINRITFLRGSKAKTEKVHKVASICKSSANEGDACIYKVSCITREHAATRKKYSGEFESLQDAMKVCAQAYNAGVDVFVECGDQPFAKIYTKTKEFEDFTEDNSASKAFREAMMWAKSPERKKNEEDFITPEVPNPIQIDTSVDPSVVAAAQDAESSTLSEIPTVSGASSFPDVTEESSSEGQNDIRYEDPNDIRVYAKNHQVVIACESRVNGFRVHRLAPGNPKPVK